MIIFYLVFPSHFPSIMDLYFGSSFLCIHFLLVFSNAGNHCTFNLKHFEYPLVTSSMWHWSSLNKQLLASLVSYRSVVNMHQAIKSGVEQIDQQCSPHFVLLVSTELGITSLYPFYIRKTQRNPQKIIVPVTLVCEYSACETG